VHCWDEKEREEVIALFSGEAAVVSTILTAGSRRALTERKAHGEIIVGVVLERAFLPRLERAPLRRIASHH